MVLVLDAGGLSALAGRAGRERTRVLRQRGLWPPLVPTVVCVEALTGRADRDAPANQFLKTCEVIDHLDLRTARRAAMLRSAAGRGSAVDALVVATAELLGGSTVLTSDPHDLSALAAYTDPAVAVASA